MAQKKNKHYRRTKFILWIGIFIYLCFLLYAPIFQEIKGFQSTQWPKTVGVITVSEATTQRGYRGSIHYYPVIRYQYIVNNTSYAGDNIFLTYWRPSGDKFINEVTHKYPIGKKVNVFYNPNLPLESCLEPGATKNLGIFFAGIFVLLCVVFIVFIKIRKN